MPFSSQPTQTEIRLNNIMTGFTGVVSTLELLADTVKAPFLGPISKTARSLLTAVQYFRTLYKIHNYVEAQQDKSKIRHFFRQGEMSTLLKACSTELQEALDGLEKYMEDKHQEVLMMIEALSVDAASDRGSVSLFSMLDNSSASISLLPSEPKIFHGRRAELSHILDLFVDKTPRLAILGLGGIGKTSLARAVLHHPQIMEKFEQRRFFVAGDSASTKDELAALIGAHLGLKPGKDVAKSIIQFFLRNPACLLILDNLETLWDPKETRGDVEEFLSLITDVQHLALLVGIEFSSVL
ncbi:hypothetical protein C8R43DRAFT_963249 [Mycena crocata]|nr:hypothetical protein C8R43DRAFT_963249 [Mycena crocata]